MVTYFMDVDNDQRLDVTYWWFWFKIFGLQEQLRNDSRVVWMEYTNEYDK
jgi:hypothetical protein